ncbi:alpha/beta fold hydrolase [Rufibacter roseus]|uniref:Alpha/beta fold hydrolase n=1 Tax=Rufibacter roseus TaxID=1567108 RepID=A0ABW2DF31_9BACT|nr:alpha/beta hydrolase [Rufibacter roseus]
MEPLLLLHGALGAQSQFEPLLPLLPAQVPVYSFNFEGHGGAGMPGGPFRIETFVQQLLEWINDRGFTKVNVFGFSMGGYVALEAARQRPENFSSIFTLATKFAWSPEAATHETSRLRPDVVTEKLPAFAQTLEERHAPQNWEEVMLRTAEMMLHLGQVPLLKPEQLSQVPVPVRIAIGDRDQIVTVEESLAVYKQLPQAELQVFPNTRHPLEQLDWPMLAQALQHFFKYAF